MQYMTALTLWHIHQMLTWNDNSLDFTKDSPN